MEQQLKIAVIGAGTMGRGITQLAAARGHEVWLTTYHEASFAQAPQRIAQFFESSVARAKLSAADRDATLARVHVVPSMCEACADVDLVIESVVEDLAIKQRLFRKLEREAAGRAVLASDTSSLSIQALAQGLEHPERVVGMHFFNPAHAMQLVEVVVAPSTPATTRDFALSVARGLGKDPIVVRDTPGFASSRLGIVLGLEAMRMVEQGVASAEDIDKALELGYRHPMGPLKLTDHVGLDVRLAIAEILAREIGGEQYQPPQILRDKVAAGELGRKTGRGFYVWDVHSGDIVR
ncbi:MAG: 3-hydroxyacyl-CoA dehydrogenase family protein [Pseudomonadota bacterium]